MIYGVGTPSLQSMYSRTYYGGVTLLMFILAIGSGVSGTILTRASDGFRKWRYGLGAVGAYAIATVAMALLLQRLPVGIVYAVWTGSAAVVLVAVDRIFFNVKNNKSQLVGMLVTFLGVVLLGTAMRS